MTAVILVPGTHGWGRSADPQWWQDGSPFTTFLQARGATAINGGRPFWSSDLNGMADRRLDWQVGGQALLDFAASRGISIRIISHSHGRQVVLWAAALGLQIDTWVDVCGPVRKDMLEIHRHARPRIASHLHLHSDNSDLWQFLGSWFDGAMHFTRKDPLADRNDFAPGGHTAVLEDEKLFSLWLERAWLAALTKGPTS